jgi:hypothetical protein
VASAVRRRRLQAQGAQIKWDRSADVVIIGAASRTKRHHGAIWSIRRQRR